MPDVIDDAKIAEANAILATFVDHLQFVPMGMAVNNRDPDDHRWKTMIHVRCPYHTAQVRLTPNGNNIRSLNAGIHYGGTVHEAIAHLYRFTQDMTRAPLAWWEYRVGRIVTLDAVRASSYLECSMTNCVLCNTGRATCDWWPEKDRQGPCCTFGACQAKGDKDAG